MGLESGRLQAYLESLAPDLVRQPGNARFIFNDETRQLESIQPATIGRSLNVAASHPGDPGRLAQGEHNVDLVFDLHQPCRWR